MSLSISLSLLAPFPSSGLPTSPTSAEGCSVCPPALLSVTSPSVSLCPFSCHVIGKSAYSSLPQHASFSDPLLYSTVQPLPYSLSFQRSLAQATPLRRAARWKPSSHNLARRTIAALAGKPGPQLSAVVNSLRCTGSSYPNVLLLPSLLPRCIAVTHQRNLPHCNKQPSNVSSNVKHFASFAEMGTLQYSPSAKPQENIVRLDRGATSYPAEPLHNSLHVLQCGIQLKELYLNSLIAARHYMHMQLYGQMSFSLNRIDLYTHRASLQFAIRSASSLSSIFGFLPFLQVLYMILRARLSFNTVIYVRHSNKSTRARLRKHYSYCTLSCIFVLYLCMTFMYIDPASGRRCILTATYTNPSNTRRRRTTYSIPNGMKQFARQCDIAFTLISSTYIRHQSSIDSSSMLAWWLWTAVYSNTDPLPYTSICIPPAETFAVALLIMYFLSPIVPTTFEILLQPSILPRYHYVRIYVYTTLHPYWLCIQLLPHQHPAGSGSPSPEHLLPPYHATTTCQHGRSRVLRYFALSPSLSHHSSLLYCSLWPATLRSTLAL
jgi:hypothetical protein